MKHMKAGRDEGSQARHASGNAELPNMESSTSGNAAACARAFALLTIPLKPHAHDGTQHRKKTNEKQAKRTRS